MPHCPIQMLADFFSLHPFPHLAQPFRRDHFIAFYFLIRNIFHYNITVEILQISVLFSFVLCYCFELKFNSFENSMLACANWPVGT